MQSGQKIIMNTGFLYGKMIISMLITLYSTRLVLNELGAEDFGIFNVVGGVIAMLAFLNAAMTVSTQRYMSYYLGKNDKEIQNNIFQTSVLLHLIIGVIIIIVLEIIGIYIFDGFLNINKERIFAAKLIFQFMIISLFFTINAVPYDAAINAHEDLYFDALMGIIDSVLKLFVAILLTYTNSDKLILFSILTASSIILIRILKSIFCNQKYIECHITYKKIYNKSLLKEMISFASWNLFGSLAALVKTQGLAVVVNLFYGTIANAAYSISNQINGQISSLSENMLKSLRPQIVKSEGSNDRNRMLKLSMIASKFSFFLLSIVAIPIMLYMPFVLKLWLKNVPEYTIIFCRLILISSLIGSLTNGIKTAVISTGKVKIYQLVVGSLLILNLPLSYYVLYLGAEAYWVYIVTIFFEIVAFIFRIYFLNKLTSLSIKTYLNQTVIKVIIPIIILGCLIILLKTQNLKETREMLIFILTYIVAYPILIYSFGSNKDERLIFANMIKKIRLLSTNYLK